jgi:hypothetical protein
LARDLALVLAATLLAALILVQALPPTPQERGLQGARRALAADPLDPIALGRYGLALDAAGQPARAKAVLDMAGTRGWRDPPVQAWLLRDRIAAGRWDEALGHADALLRIDADGAWRPGVFPLLNLAAADPTSRTALVGRLARRPWWRQAWLERFGAAMWASWRPAPAATPGATLDPASARAVLLALSVTPAPPSPAEYRPYVAALIAHGDDSEALADWRALAHRPHAGGALRDGDFAAPADGTDFTWRPASGVGADSEIAAAEPGSGSRVLKVDYDGFSAPVLPAQRLVLGPGRWRLTWRERLAGPSRLAWRVRCASSDAPLAAETSAPSPAWSWRTLFLEVPPAGCPAQWLELAPAPGERRTDITAAYAAFALTGG